MTHSVILYPLVPTDLSAPPPGPEIVGAKAHNLMRMAQAGLRAPAGFVLGVDLCRAYQKTGKKALAGVEAALQDALSALARQTGQSFGDPRRPLLLSVRSGAAVSMPGMMETVLNVGLNDHAVTGLIRLSGNPRLAWDSYRRLVAQYGQVVENVPASAMEALLDAAIAEARVESAADLDSAALQALTERSKEIYRATVGAPFPQDPMAQLLGAIEAVLKSWNSPRAIAYRKRHQLDGVAGTATTLQRMVFGNAGGASGSGVGFTRNPADGEKALYLDFLPNAQGEDVVSGVRNAFGEAGLADLAPQAEAELRANTALLEATFRDMQDFEFTVERGVLHMLQARSGKRTPLAALRIAVDLAEEGLISKEEALARIDGLALDRIERQVVEPRSGEAPLAQATPASAGAASGVAVYDPERLPAILAKGMKAILIREQTVTEDIAALSDCEGLITATGARTSHAAVVARQLGKLCLVGCETLTIAPDRRGARFGDVEIAEGDVLTLDGETGRIYRGEAVIRREKPEALLARVAEWRAATDAARGAPPGNRKKAKSTA